MCQSVLLVHRLPMIITSNSWDFDIASLSVGGRSKMAAREVSCRSRVFGDA